MTVELATPKKDSAMLSYHEASSRFRVAYQYHWEYHEAVILETRNMFIALKSAGYTSKAAINKIKDYHKDLKGFSKSSIYSNLQDEVKIVTRPKKIPENVRSRNLSRAPPSREDRTVEGIENDGDINPSIIDEKTRISESQMEHTSPTNKPEPEMERPVPKEVYLHDEPIQGRSRRQVEHSIMTSILTHPKENVTHDIAITCNQCCKPLLVEYDLATEQTNAYDLTDLSNDQKQIIHKHPCNPDLRNSVIKAVEVEKRYLYDQNMDF